MGLARIELATSRLSGVRSNQLSYRPINNNPAIIRGIKKKRGKGAENQAVPSLQLRRPSGASRTQVPNGIGARRFSGFRTACSCERCSPCKTFLVRKEVIQPHLPVRLPCYDFTPLTRHTFGTVPRYRLD